MPEAWIKWQDTITEQQPQVKMHATPHDGYLHYFTRCFTAQGGGGGDTY